MINHQKEGYIQQKTFLVVKIIAENTQCTCSRVVSDNVFVDSCSINQLSFAWEKFSRGSREPWSGKLVAKKLLLPVNREIK